MTACRSADFLRKVLKVLASWSSMADSWGSSQINCSLDEPFLPQSKLALIAGVAKKRQKVAREPARVAASKLERGAVFFMSVSQAKMLLWGYVKSMPLRG